jgi:hypothetical protein
MRADAVAGAPPGRALAIQNPGNLNPFVYQESAGSANCSTTYWNLGSVQELPVSEQFTWQLDFMLLAPMLPVRGTA